MRRHPAFLPLVHQAITHTAHAMDLGDEGQSRGSTSSVHIFDFSWGGPAATLGREGWAEKAELFVLALAIRSVNWEACI